MLRIINLVFIFLLLSIYSMKKLKTTQTQCKVKKTNVASMSNMGMMNLFISGDKLYYDISGKTVEIPGIKPKRAQIDQQKSLVIDTDDKLRLLTFPRGKNGTFNVTPANTFTGTYRDLIKLPIGPAVIRKNDSAIMRFNRTELVEYAVPIPNIKQICGYRNIFVYTNDDFLGFMDLRNKFVLRLIVIYGNKIKINPKSKLTCTINGVFYGAQDDNVLTLYDEINRKYIKTNIPITERVEGIGRNSTVTTSNENQEWSECPNYLSK